MKHDPGRKMDASDFSNTAPEPVACPNCGRYDWVLNPLQVDADGRLLWACPCGEFRWTSYAEWEARDRPEDMLEASLEGLKEWEKAHRDCGHTQRSAADAI